MSDKTTPLGAEIDRLKAENATLRTQTARFRETMKIVLLVFGYEEQSVDRFLATAESEARNE